MTQKQLNEAVAKLHLERGDSLIIDARVIDVEGLVKNLRVPKGAEGGLIFAVYPVAGQSLREAFLIMKDEELTKLTKFKLRELLDAAS